MVAERPTLAFSWAFLQEMAYWTFGIGLVAAIAGGIALGNPLFSAALFAGVLADVVIVRTTAHQGMRDEAEGHMNPQHAVLFVGGRLGIKALILVVAFLSPDRQVFWGAVAGAVLFDTVLLLVGSFRAATTMFGTGRR